MASPMILRIARGALGRGRSQSAKSGAKENSRKILTQFDFETMVDDEAAGCDFSARCVGVFRET
jgi:hypothetical protein